MSHTIGKDNLTTKPLRRFGAGDSLYVQQTRSGFTQYYLCEFIRLEKGTVVVRVVEREASYVPRQVGDVIRTRAKSCYLWGKDSVTQDSRCHWFKNLDNPVN